MPGVPGPAGAALLVGVSVLGTLLVLAVWARIRYTRRLPAFRCRLGPSAVRRGRGRSRWCRRRTWGTWVDGVLVVRCGVLRLWLAPLSVGVPQDVTVTELRPREVRGLGPRPVSLRFTTTSGARELEVAVAAEDADRLVGPFLTAALTGLPDARRQHGG